MRKKTYLKLVDYQTEQSEKHLNEVRSIHKEMRGYKHDFHHHLQTLKGQLEAGEIERALAYIEQLDTQLMHVDTLLKTGNVSLDAILSAKIAQAKAEAWQHEGEAGKLTADFMINKLNSLNGGSL